MHQFDEHHVEFEGFSDYYAREILPRLQQAESRRLEAIAKGKRAYIYTMLVSFLIIGFWVWREAQWYVSLWTFVFGIVIGFMLLGYMTRHVAEETKAVIVGHMCRFLGLAYQSDVTTSPRLHRFTQLGLVSSGYDRANFEDQISGTAHGAGFLIHEAHLERRVKTKNGYRWDTTFRGQLLVMEFKRKFLGRTVVLRDKGWFQSEKKGDMKRVGLVDPVFEKIFEAYGTDQVEARYLLTPTFMQRLVDLEHSVDGKNIRFGFIGGELLIAVETSNRYESGSMFSPLTDTTRTQKILDEIGAIYDVIDGVMKPAGRT